MYELINLPFLDSKNTRRANISDGTITENGTDIDSNGTVN